MSKAIFALPFDNSLPRWPDTNGEDQITMASRVDESKILIESEAMEDIKANSGWIFVEDVE